MREELTVLNKCEHEITDPPKKSASKIQNCNDYFLCLRTSAEFGLARGDLGWNQSTTVTSLVLLKEPGHHVAGGPVTQKTQKLIFRNVLMLLACMAGSEGMICCVSWDRTEKDWNSVPASCGLKATFRFWADCFHHVNTLYRAGMFWLWFLFPDFIVILACLGKSNFKQCQFSYGNGMNRSANQE